MNTGEKIRIFLLGMAVALLGVIAFRPSDQRASAQMAGENLDVGGAVTALTATGPGPDQITLFLIDPARQAIAYYSAKHNQPFSLRQVRYYKNDLAMARIETKDNFQGGGITTKEAEKLAATK